MKPAFAASAVRAAIIATLLAALGGPVAAQSFPTRPVTLVVNSEAAGPVDVNARIIKDEMQAALGQPLIVENRVGGGGMVGAAYVSHATPDGYTIVVGSPGAFVLAPHLYNTGYDALKDFEPVALITEVPVLFAIGANSPAKTLAEFVNLARAQPGKLNYGSGGNATPAHLGAELLKSLANVNMVHIPYRGTPQALAALMAGDVALFLSGPAAVLPQEAAGKIRLIAVSTKTRIKLAAHVPTTAEAGYPDLTVPAWYGVYAPRGTPRAVINTLAAAFRKTLDNKAIRDKFEAASYLVINEGPEALGTLTRGDFERWGAVIRKAGIKG